MTLQPPPHGGIDGARALFPEGIVEEEILDFSISVNPLGPPPGLREVLEAALERLHCYPEISAATLTEHLAAYHGLSPDHFIVGNGTADLLFALIPQLPRREAVIPFPTFIEYERACAVNGWKILHVPPVDGGDFTFDPRGIADALTDGATLFLCQPNNPTGCCLDRGSLKALLERAERRGCTVVVDEAFLPFTDVPSAVPWVARHRRLIVLRSMTKSFAIPGLRLGYAAASPDIIERWRTSLPPWNVNNLAQAAGLFCLERGEAHLARSKRYIREERKRFTEEIRNHTSFEPLPSEANFLLVYLGPDFAATRLYLSLARRGLLVRHCGSFRGMGDHHIRIGLKTRAENQRLLDALRAIAGEASLEAAGTAAGDLTA